MEDILWQVCQTDKTYKICGVSRSSISLGRLQVRGLNKQPTEGEGVWLDDWRRTKGKEAKKLGKPEPRTFSAIRAARKLAEKEEKTGVLQVCVSVSLAFDMS